MFRHLLKYIRTLWEHLFYNSHEVLRIRQQQAEQQAADILRCLHNGDWGGLRAHFVSPLQYVITETVLEKGWQAITASTGSLKRAEKAVVTAGWFGLTAKVPLHFSRSIRLTMSLQMTRSGNLYGLKLEPYVSAPWSTPNYARTDITTDKFVLGSGLGRVQAELTTPADACINSPVPCIILIGGSGPVDKDSTVGASKPFKDLSLGLASRSIAVLRFDKVTSTLLAKLWYRKSRITLTDEYVHHVTSAISQARQHPSVDADRIILLGHSLGALIAARIALIDSRIAGCILMAAPAEPMYRCAIRQMRYMASLDVDRAADNVSYANDNEALLSLEKQSEMADSQSLRLSTPASELPFGIGPAYWLEYRGFDPLETLALIRKPVLILQGSRDYQVTVKDDYSLFRERLQGSNFTFRVFDNLNHLFIYGEGMSTPSEYDEPGNVHPTVISYLSEWVETSSTVY